MNHFFHFFGSDSPIYYVCFGLGSAGGCVIRDLWGPAKSADESLTQISVSRELSQGAQSVGSFDDDQSFANDETAESAAASKAALDAKISRVKAKIDALKKNAERN